jgi:hypothetical protein
MISKKISPEKGMFQLFERLVIDCQLAIAAVLDV